MNFEVIDTEGHDVDLTPYTIRLTSRTQSDGPIIFQKEVDHSDTDNDLENGRFVVKLNHEDTNKRPKEYPYSVTIISADGMYDTPFLGTITFIPSMYY